MKPLIYADNAATTQMDIDAFEAMKPYLLEQYGNASQPYSFAREPKKAIHESREIIASCIGALPEEIYFTSGGTESDNWAIKSIVFQSQDRRETITSAIEHHAVLRACEAIRRMNYPVDYLLPNETGTVSPETLEQHISNKTLLVSVMYANNELGTIQPIKDLCKVAHSNGALFHTDAVQAVGHIQIDVNDLGIDMLSASAHKFNGAKGIGFLYVRKGTPIAAYINGGNQEFGLRAGTENTAGIVSMAIALKKNVDTIESNQKHIIGLEKMLLYKLNERGIPFTRNGGNHTLPGIINLSFEGKDGEAILHRMDLMGISISTGSACDSKNTEISHVLQAIQLPTSLAKGTIRISLGKSNTSEDVETIVSALNKILM